MKWTKIETRPVATAIYTAINERRNTMPAGKNVTAAFLVGKSVWNKLDSAQRRFAGKFVSICVRRGMLGLKQVRRNSNNHWLYAIT